ncbi:tryptophan--tRNA ligase [Candidatus Pacearchaeota archaeon]|nr:tryptophan--tRNA ligase [Candidatus Pacearchaeota archaeon]
MIHEELSMSNEKLVREFGATPISHIKDLPKFYTFEKNLIHSHRDFDKFLKALKNKEKCAIVSGFNASGTIHLGHKPVFDTNLYFQKEYGIPVFIPISDDESYVAGKVETQEEALKNSLALAKELLAYGFDPHKTYFIIDQIYTNIYNLAIKLSTKVNLSEIKATYGYENDDNIGLHFYPTIQAAHILFPQHKFGIKNTLVIIGPDEDAHIRICRDIASRMGYEKPSILHSTFMPGTDGAKMSKSKNNALFFNDDKKMIINKIGKAFSGGQKTIEEHRKIGGNPEVDVSCLYLSKYFLNEKESKKLFEDYRKGKLLSGEVKKMLSDNLTKMISEFQERVNKVNKKDLDKAIMKNETN